MKKSRKKPTCVDFESIRKEYNGAFAAGLTAPASEVAKKLGISVSTVYRAIHRMDRQAAKTEPAKPKKQTNGKHPLVISIQPELVHPLRVEVCDRQGRMVC